MLGYKQCLNNLDMKFYLISYWVKNISNYQKELFELMEISIIYSKQTISEKFKSSNKKNIHG